MSIRITGLNSGLDTESIISELVSAKSMKVSSLKKEKIRLSWKQDAWKELNSKIYNLYSNVLGNLRLSSSYVKKKSVVSDPSVISVSSGTASVNGVQTLHVESLAKAAYLTGGKVQKLDGDKVDADTKLTDLGIASGSSIKINNTEISVDSSMTMGDFTKKLQETGFNTSFDSGQQRLFVSAKETGKTNDFSFSGDLDTLGKLGLVENGDSETGAVKIDGSDAVMYLNGAKFVSSTNTFEINGTTYTVNGISEKDALGKWKETSITTSDDYDGIYDTIKNFLTEYNKLINEMDKLYNAESTRGLDPLTSEEKDALSDSEVEDWEKKIKDSLLRRDTNLSSVISTLTMGMTSGIEIDGKTMHLSDFGINTLGYFNAADNEKHAYYIDGDSSVAGAAEKEDVLKKMIATDPGTVQNFFTKLTANMYDSLFEIMGTTEYSSIYKVYNDKEMTKELSDYDSKISEAEEKLNEFEDKWYKKFSKMETALAKMSSKQSAISSLFSS